MSIFRDFYLPFMFIAILIGYQISVYFLYQYVKYKKEKLKLHILLLGYALIFGITLTAFAIRIINLYFLKESYPKIFENVARITYLLFYLGVIAFFLVISSKTFNKIINTRIIRVLAFLLIIPIIITFILTIETLLYSAIAGLTVGTSYGIILYFQNKLATLATGDIRRRLRLIFWGIIFLVISHLIGGYTPSYVLLSAYSELIQSISAPLFTVGLLIFFLGAYKFPAFLEFDWRENIIGLFIVNKNNYSIIYQYDFDPGRKAMPKESTKRTDETNLLFSRGIVGIENIISLVLESTDKHIEKISHGNYLILLEHADEPFSFLIFCLMVKKELTSLKYLIKKIKEEFLKQYSPILPSMLQSGEVELKIFSNFDKIIKQSILNEK